MYECPLNIIMNDIGTQFEQRVLKAVQRCGIYVVKDELIKALDYDRKQYEKGYADAKSEQRWIPCSERLPKDDDWKIVTILDGHGDTPYRYSDFGWYLDKAECWIIDAEQRTDVIAWMLLPEPYNQMFPTQMSETLSAGRRPTEWKEEKDDETRSD